MEGDEVMREQAAIVEAHLDIKAIERDIGRELIALQDGERSEKTITQQNSERRLKIGKLLVQARANWPKAGPNARGWGEFLSRIGIAQQTAHTWMVLAGWSETNSPESSEMPTRREAGLEKRALKSETPGKPPTRLVRDDEDLDSYADEYLDLPPDPVREVHVVRTEFIHIKEATITRDKWEALKRLYMFALKHDEQLMGRSVLLEIVPSLAVEK